MAGEEKSKSLQKDEFRAYLESSGTVNSLTRALISLYDEQQKPENGTKYIQDILTSLTESTLVEDLKAENTALKEEVASLKLQLEDFQKVEGSVEEPAEEET